MGRWQSFGLAVLAWSIFSHAAVAWETVEGFPAQQRGCFTESLGCCCGSSANACCQDYESTDSHRQDHCGKEASPDRSQSVCHARKQAHSLSEAGTSRAQSYTEVRNYFWKHGRSEIGPCQVSTQPDEASAGNPHQDPGVFVPVLQSKTLPNLSGSSTGLSREEVLEQKRTAAQIAAAPVAVQEMEMDLLALHRVWPDFLRGPVSHMFAGLSPFGSRYSSFQFCRPVPYVSSWYCTEGCVCGTEAIYLGRGSPAYRFLPLSPLLRAAIDCSRLFEPCIFAWGFRWAGVSLLYFCWTRRITWQAESLYAC